MISNTITISLIYLAAGAVDAFQLAARAIGDCTDFHLQGQWLVANCLPSLNLTDRIQSTVYLPNKITNHEGTLEVTFHQPMPLNASLIVGSGNNKEATRRLAATAFS